MVLEYRVNGSETRGTTGLEHRVKRVWNTGYNGPGTRSTYYLQRAALCRYNRANHFLKSMGSATGGVAGVRTPPMIHVCTYLHLSTFAHFLLSQKSILTKKNVISLNILLVCKLYFVPKNVKIQYVLKNLH